MGQVSTPRDAPSLILTATDRLVASNADGGLAISSAHVILLGQAAGQNLNASNVIAMGFNAFKGGLVGMSGADADFSTVVGEQSFTGPADLTTGKLTGLGSVTIIGGGNYSAFTANTRLAGLICIGSGIAPDYVGSGSQGMDRSILIGNSIFKNNILNNALSNDNVIIGHLAASRTSLNGQATQYLNNVIVGSQAGPQTNSLAVIQGNTIIGSRAAQGMLGPAASNNVIIGFIAGSTLTNTSNNVIIGEGAAVSGTSNVCIGQANSQGSANTSIFIGANQNRGFTSALNILLGFGAGELATPATGNQLIVETFDGVALRTAMFGDMGSGNIILGNSSPGTNRDMSGTNTLKLLNGTAGAIAPTGGGRFYVTGGQLHWVDGALVDYALTPSASVGIFAVAGLPPAPPAGTRAYVNDSLAPAFGAAVAPGGAVFIPVFFNGAAWIVG